MKTTDKLRENVREVGDCVWEISPDAKPGMRVPARVYASRALLEQMDQGVFEQVTNVACLPGIVGAALCMPDGHWGYGFPIGGVAAFREDSGVISPGGIGFDINCGMRLIRTGLTEDAVRPRLAELIVALFTAVPSGVGAKGLVHLSEPDFERVMVEGAGWCAGRGLGFPEDLDHSEGRGLPRRRRSRPRERPRNGPRDGSARHAGLGRPLPRDPGDPPGRHPRRARGPSLWRGGTVCYTFPRSNSQAAKHREWTWNLAGPPLYSNSISKSISFTSSSQIAHSATTLEPPQMRSGRRPGSFPLLTAARAFSRRIGSSGTWLPPTSRMES